MHFLKLSLIFFICCSCQSDDGDIVVVVSNNNDINNNENDNVSRNLVITKVSDLDTLINETSGLLNINGRIVTHNDSGGKPSFYEIDVTTGNVIRTVTILNAVNVDIEDIAQDENYIYLSDIGNNSNSRKDQTIYKISKSDYFTKNDVIAEKIMFSYNEQFDFEKSNGKTNFDAEAVVHMDGNLFLFTKNWGDLKTSVYKIPKEKGKYILNRISSLNIEGLVTGADYNSVKKTIVLTGYTNFIPFVVELSNFSTDNPLDGKMVKKTLFLNSSKQIEGIAFNPDGSYYITAEKSSGFPAVLYKLTY